MPAHRVRAGRPAPCWTTVRHARRGQQAAADRFFKRHAVYLHSGPGGSDVMLRESTAHHRLGRIEYLKMTGSVPGQHFSQGTETDAELIPRLRIKKQQRAPRTDRSRTLSRR